VRRTCRGWRPRGRRSLRSRRGQVSAIATLFGLLIVVSFISASLLELPTQKAQVEFAHQLQVEDQLEILQQNVLAAAANPSLQLPVTNPVRLGSDPIPPFSPAALGSIAAQIAPNTGTSLGLNLIAATPPAWHTGTPCPTQGNGNQTCSGNGVGPVLYYNQSGSNIRLSPGMNGCGTNGCGLFYNISGNNDSIVWSTTGNNVGAINFVIVGNNDTFYADYSGTCTNHRTVNATFYGNYDAFQLNVSGCSNGAGVAAQANFVSISADGAVCPSGNPSHDRLLPPQFTGGVSGTTMNVTWFGTSIVGSNPNPHLVNLGNNDIFKFQNVSTAFYLCAFTTLLNLPFNAFNGILVHLYNQYLPSADIIYQDGAVIQGTASGSLMLSPPNFTISRTSAGLLRANLMLMQLTGGFPTTTGSSTTPVETQILSESTYVLQNGTNGNIRVRLPFVLNITTAYPQAWLNYFQPSANSSQATYSLFPSGATCMTVPSSYCTAPPGGVLANIKVPVSSLVQVVRITIVVVKVGL
jgi:hypothetical protein